MRLKDFVEVIKGNDFELYNNFEELIYSTMSCYNTVKSLLPYAKHEIDLVECCIKRTNLTPYLRIYITEKEI